jgi:hypothetical protein
MNGIGRRAISSLRFDSEWSERRDKTDHASGTTKIQAPSRITSFDVGMSSQYM